MFLFSKHFCLTFNGAKKQMMQIENEIEFMLAFSVWLRYSALKKFKFSSGEREQI